MFRSRFIFFYSNEVLQVRHVGEMVKLTFQGEKSEAGVSSFQALALSLSGRVGTGNIAGVATAVAFVNGELYFDVGSSLFRCRISLCRINTRANI